MKIGRYHVLIVEADKDEQFFIFRTKDSDLLEKLSGVQNGTHHIKANPPKGRRRVKAGIGPESALNGK